MSIETEVRAAQEAAHKAAQKAEQAQQRLSAAQAETIAARDQRVRQWAIDTVNNYPDEVAAHLEAIRDSQRDFFEKAVTDLPGAVQAYIAWFAARRRLELRFQVQQSALTEIDGTGTAATNLPSPVPSFAPSFDRALAEAVSLAVSSVANEMDDEHHRQADELRRA